MRWMPRSSPAAATIGAPRRCSGVVHATAVAARSVPATSARRRGRWTIHSGSPVGPPEFACRGTSRAGQGLGGAHLAGPARRPPVLLTVVGERVDGVVVGVPALEGV